MRCGRAPDLDGAIVFRFAISGHFPEFGVDYWATAPYQDSFGARTSCVVAWVGSLAMPEGVLPSLPGAANDLEDLGDALSFDISPSP